MCTVTNICEHPGGRVWSFLPKHGRTQCLGSRNVLCFGGTLNSLWPSRVCSFKPPWEPPICKMTTLDQQDIAAFSKNRTCFCPVWKVTESQIGPFSWNQFWQSLLPSRKFNSASASLYGPIANVKTFRQFNSNLLFDAGSLLMPLAMPIQ